MPEDSNNARIDRRAFVATVAGVAAAGATGCLDALDGGGNETNGGNTPSPGLTGPVEDTYYEGRNLVIEVEEDHNIEEIAVINEDGSSVTSTGIDPAETRAEVRVAGESGAGVLGQTGLPDGEYELVVIDDEGDRIESMEYVHDPQIEIVDFYFDPGLKNGEGTYEEGELIEDYDLPVAYAVIENTGEAPITIDEIDVDYEELDDHYRPINTARHDMSYRRDDVLEPGDTLDYQIGVVQYGGLISSQEDSHHDAAQKLVILEVETASETVEVLEMVLESRDGPTRVEYQGRGTNNYRVVYDEIEAVEFRQGD